MDRHKQEFSTTQVNMAQLATATVVQRSQSKRLENTMSFSCRLDFFLIIRQSLICAMLRVFLSAIYETDNSLI